jgi:hypothetical protein
MVTAWAAPATGLKRTSPLPSKNGNECSVCHRYFVVTDMLNYHLEVSECGRTADTAAKTPAHHP